MKYYSIMAVSLLSLLVTACTKNTLSKPEAEKQLSDLLQKKTVNLTFKITAPLIQGTTAPKERVAKLDKLEQAGYLTYSLVQWQKPEWYTNNQFTVVTLDLKDKIIPLLVKKTEWFNERGFPEDEINLTGIRVQGGTGTYTADVVSITEAAANAEGKIVSIVTYKKRPVLQRNQLATLYGWNPEPFEFDTVAKEATAQFVKTQEGWKIQD